MSGFTITRGSGFQVTFANGYTVSVQFGDMSYCESQDYKSDRMQSRDYPDGHSCVNAEVAVLTPGGGFFRLAEFDDVAGWVTPEQVARVMAAVAAHDPASGGLDLTLP